MTPGGMELQGVRARRPYLGTTAKKRGVTWPGVWCSFTSFWCVLVCSGVFCGTSALLLGTGATGPQQRRCSLFFRLVTIW